MDLGGVIDLVPLLQHLLGAVPLWAIMFLIVQYWMKSNKKDHHDVNEQLFLLNQKLGRIEAMFNDLRVDDMKDDIQVLRESRARDSAKLEELYRRTEKFGIKPAREN